MPSLTSWGPNNTAWIGAPVRLDPLSEQPR